MGWWPWFPLMQLKWEVVQMVLWLRWGMENMSDVSIIALRVDICQIMPHILPLSLKWRMEAIFFSPSSFVSVPCKSASFLCCVYLKVWGIWLNVTADHNFYVAVEMPSVLLMAAVRNVQMVCNIFHYFWNFNFFSVRFAYKVYVIGKVMTIYLPLRQGPQYIKWWRTWSRKWGTR